PSTAGQMFREFGLVLAIAVAISSFVALSLVPAMAARLNLQKDDHGPVYTRILMFGGHMARGYNTSLGKVLDRPWLTTAISVILAVGAGWLYTQLNQELLPPEDRGVIYVDATGPDGVGINYISRQAGLMEDILQPLVTSGEATSLYTTVGSWDPNRAQILVPLAPWEQRHRSVHQIMDEIRGPLAEMPGARVRVGSPNSLSLRGAGGGIEVALVGNEYAEIYQAARDMTRAIQERLPHLSQTDISYRPTQPQLSIEIDRRRAAELQVPLESIATTLRAAVDGLDLEDLNVGDDAIPILLETASSTITSPQDLTNLYVKSDNGRLVPLSNLVTIREEAVASQLDRHAQRRAIEVSAAIAPGYPLANVVEDLRQLARDVLPPSVDMILLG